MNNPQAFPRPYSESEGIRAFAVQDGMTLRDYFAAKALQGMLARFESRDADPVPIPMYAEDAYRYADAMLAEREK